MKSLLLLCLLLLLSFVGLSQTEEAAVKIPIQQLFEGMKKSDSAMVHQTLLVNARLESIVKAKSGDISVRSDSFDGFLKSIGKATPGDLDERLSGMQIRIDGDLATAGLPINFITRETLATAGSMRFN